MKASLFVTAALACTLASAATAQQVGQIQPTPTKGVKASTQTKSGQINLGTTGSKSSAGPSAALNPRPGGSTALILDAGETCATGTAISGPTSRTGNNLGAAMDTPVPCSVAPGGTPTGGPAVGDVWYSWTATATGSQVITFCVLADAGATADFDTLLAVYSACGGTMLACNDDGPGCDPGPGTGTVPGDWTSTVQFGVTSGNVYKIQIAGFDAGSGFGNYTMVIKPVVAPPTNDNCATPIALPGTPGPHAFDNTNGTTGPQHQAETGCTQYGLTAVNADLWFTWTNPNPSGSLRLSACAPGAPGNTVDTKLGVYADTGGCPAGATVGCNDDLCGLQSQVDFPGTLAATYVFQIGTYPGGIAEDQGIGVFGGPGNVLIVPTPTGPPNDDCATPAATVFGPGPHPFDTSTANTGTQGQAEPLCNAGSTAINNDQWFKWTAFGTGQAILNTCGQTTVDTKVAVYPNPGGATACPAAPAIGCDDDACNPGLQSTVCFPVTNGVTYVIQMGTFPGAVGGAGTFGFTIGASGVLPCKQDDGIADNALGWTVGGDMAWIQRFDMGVSFNVGSIQVVYGTLAFPGGGPVDGSPARVLLYEDPTNDGDPSDVVLLQNVATTVANVDTDIYNTVPIPSTLVSGVFFAGAAELHGAGQFVAVMDETCPIGEQTWFFGDNAAVPATNYANPSASPIAIQSFLTAGFPTNLMVRTCALSPMIGQCFPGTGGVINCPCPSQPPANPTGGCQNHGAGFTSGGVLSATGLPDVSTDTLVITSSGMRPAASVLNVFFSYKPGAPTPTPGTISGAGIRCTGTGGSLKRLYTGNSSGGSISRPGMGDLSVSAKSATFAGHAIVPPETRYYFNVYRDGQASVAGCPGGAAVTTNLTNMGAVSWVP